MTSGEARIRVSLKEGEFELNGSEEFVSTQIEAFREMIVLGLKERKTFAPSSESKDGVFENGVNGILSPSTLTDGNDGKEEVNSFPKVFHLEGDGSVKIILKKMPGNNLAQKTINLALLYLWAKRSLGFEEVLTSEIRTLCEEHGCLDRSNFSTQLKTAREFFIVSGKDGSNSKTCKITYPGMEKALQVLKEMPI